MQGRSPVGGNWKMNTNRTTRALDLTRRGRCPRGGHGPKPPFSFFSACRAIDPQRSRKFDPPRPRTILKPDGAFTGEVSLDMLRTAGRDRARRAQRTPPRHHRRNDEIVNTKLRRLSMRPDRCPVIGETFDRSRESGSHRPGQSAPGSGPLADVSADYGARDHRLRAVWAISKRRQRRKMRRTSTESCVKLLSQVYNADVARRTRIILRRESGRKRRRTLPASRISTGDSSAVLPQWPQSSPRSSGPRPHAKAELRLSNTSGARARITRSIAQHGIHRLCAALYPIDIPCL